MATGYTIVFVVLRIQHPDPASSLSVASVKTCLDKIHLFLHGSCARTSLPSSSCVSTVAQVTGDLPLVPAGTYRVGSILIGYDD